MFPDFNEILSAGMVLFAVIDIIGAIPLIINLRQNTGKIESEKATIVSFAIMTLFLFFGERLLGILSVDVNSFAVAGSLVIFFLALEMILGIRIYKEEQQNTSSIVPLAFPLIAGAGTLTSIISLRAAYHYGNIIVAIFINSILVYAVLKNTTRIEGILGKAGIAVLRKSFGIILMAIAVKLFTGNIKFLLD